MSDTSSAALENLEVFVTDAGAATERLQQAVSGATAPVMDFYDAPCDPRFRPAGSADAFAQAGKLVSDNRTDERWISGIRRAFIDADTNVLPDATIAARLTVEGISPTAPGQMTVDEPVYTGAVMYSGWSDDPVCTGAGHFLDIDEDLAMPPSLRTLAWSRVYSSRFVRSEGLGRGWYSWAAVRLEPRDESVVYHGPDGQVAPFARTGAGTWLRHPGMDADLVESARGFELRWRWNGRWPGMTWRFERGGRLAELVDPFGGRTVAVHEDGRLVGLSHEGGRSLAIGWDGPHVAEVTSSDGRRVVYRYDGDDLIGVDRPSGLRRYVVGGDGLVAEVTDADGVRLVRNDYDPDGRVLAQESPFGRVARYQYAAPRTLVVGDDDGGPATLYRHDAAGRLTEMQLSDGRRATREFDDGGNPCRVVGFDGGVTERRFDAADNCVWEAAPGGGWHTYRYDPSGRLVASVDQAGADLRLSYDEDAVVPARLSGPLGFERTFDVRAGRIVAAHDADGVVVAYDYDGDGQVVAITDGEGATTRLRYHPSGRLAERTTAAGEVERWERDQAGRAVAYVAPDGGRWERTLSPAGRVLSETDPTGSRLSYRWGDHGQLTQVVDAAGESTSLTWDTLGNRIGTELPGGARWSYSYDSLGRLAAWVDPTSEQWKLSWAANGALGTLFDPMGNGVEVEYDTAGRRVTSRSPAGRQLDLFLDESARLVAGSADSGASSCEVDRDVLGRITAFRIDGCEVGRWTYTPGGRVATVSAPHGGAWRWSYDRAGRPVRVERPDGADVLGYDPSGRVVHVERRDLTGAVAASVDLAYGADGRIESVCSGGVSQAFGWDGAGRLAWQSEGDDPPRRFRYDTGGNLVEAVDALNASSSFEYNPRGALVAALDPLRGRWSYERDQVDRLVATTDPLGRTSRVVLDPAGHVAGAIGPDGLETAYDMSPDGTLTRIGAADGRDLLRSDTDLEARRTVVQRGDGRRLEVTVDGLDRVVRYETDGHGNRVVYGGDGTVGMHVSGLPPFDIRVDGEGRVSRLEAEGLAPVTVRRDGAGRVVEVACGDLRRIWERDGAGRVVAYREATGASETVTTLERDRSGRVVVERRGEVERGGGSVERRYRYDAAGQLRGMDTPDGSWTWEYDANGRMVWEQAPDGARRFDYDAAGQLTAEELTTEDGQGGLTRYSYDARGRRLRKDGPQGSTAYEWDDVDELTAVVVTGRDGLARRTDIGVDAIGRLCSVDGRPAGDIPGARPGALGVREGDATVVEVGAGPVARIERGSARVLSTDWQGSVGDRSPWGGPGGAGTADAARVGWLGEIELDGVVWLRHRAYDPATHSFLSPDPGPGIVGVPGGLHPYSYARNDPLQWLDPLGLSPVSAAAAAEQMQSWQQGHWKEVLITAVAVVGTGLLLATGAGELMLPMLIGAAAGGLSTVGGDVLFNHGHIDWGEVAMNTATGALFGAAAGPLAGRVAGIFTGTGTDVTASAVARLASSSAMDQLPQWGRIAVNVPIGGAFGATQSAADSIGTNQAITWQNEALGIAGGATPGLIPTRTFADVMDPEVRDAMENWAGRHPNAQKFSLGLGRAVAAAQDQVSVVNTLRVQPPTFLSGTVANLINAGLNAP